MRTRWPRRAGGSPRRPSSCTGRSGPARTTVERGRRSRGRAAAHRLPPLPHRRRPVRGLLEPLLRGDILCPTSSHGARSTTRTSGSRARSTTSTRTTSAPSRCSATSSATSSSSTQSRPTSRRCRPPRRGGRDPRGSAGALAVARRRDARRGATPCDRLPDLALADGRAVASRGQRQSSWRCALVEGAPLSRLQRRAELDLGRQLASAARARARRARARRSRRTR